MKKLNKSTPLYSLISRRYSDLLFLALFAITLSTGCARSGSRTEGASNATLIIGSDQEFESLHPTISQMAASSYLYTMSTRHLVTIDADWQWRCVLCVEIPTLENGRAKFIKDGEKRKIQAEWEIKPEAQWADGNPVTGHDVLFGWEVGSHENVSVGNKEVYTQIESVVVDEENPKRFTMTYIDDRYNFNHLGVFYVLPEHIEKPIFDEHKNNAGAYEQNTLYTTKPTTVGLYNGPYVLTEWRLGSHVTFEKNPNWWGHQPKIERIIVRVVPNTQALEANLLSGAVHMISELGFPLDQALSLERRMQREPALNDRLLLDMKPGMIYEHLTYNLRNEIIADLRVRKALIKAINRKELVSALFEDRQSIAHSHIHPRDVYHTEKLRKYSHSTEKASALLDEAGWIQASPGEVRVKDGQPLQLILMSTAQNKTRELVQTFIQEQWRKVGIGTTIRNEPARVFFGETVRKGEFPHLALFAWVSSPDNPPESILHSKNIPSAENGFSGQNSGAFNHAGMDAIFDKIKTEHDLSKRQSLMLDFARIYTEELPALPLYHRVEIAVVPKGLRGYQMTGHQFFSTQDVEYWHFDENQSEKETDE